MATATDDEQDHVGVHYSGPHAGCLTHEADLKAKLAAAEARCAELERSLAICAKGFDGLAATMKAQKARAARYEAALREIVHYGWYAKAARVARAALAEVK